MGVYSRFKQKGADGFRALVELLETTPLARRQKMIDVGMAEDPDYTNKALDLMLTFPDLAALSDIELAELVATAVPRVVAFSIKMSDEVTISRFLKNAKAPVAAEIRNDMMINISLREVGAAQLKLIEQARRLEKSGLVKAKRIPS